MWFKFEKDQDLLCIGNLRLYSVANVIGISLQNARSAVGDRSYPKTRDTNVLNISYRDSRIRHFLCSRWSSDINIHEKSEVCDEPGSTLDPPRTGVHCRGCSRGVSTGRPNVPHSSSMFSAISLTIPEKGVKSVRRQNWRRNVSTKARCIILFLLLSFFTILN